MTFPPRHVVQVVHRLDVGGLENGVVNLVNRMPAERYRNTIVCLAGYGDEFRRRIQRADVDVISLDKRPGKDLPMYGRMWRVLRRLRPDVIHTRNFSTVDMQWVAVAAGVPVRVHGEHGWEASDPGGRDPKRLRIRRACRPAIQRYAPMSKDLALWLEQGVGVPASRIRQLYSGVDSDRFNAGGALPGDLPWQRDPVARPVVIGTVGRLDPVKNQRALLTALRWLLDARPQMASRLRLVIAGDGPLRGELTLAAAALGLGDRVWFAGNRQDTPDVLRAMDIFALPSLNEGISNTILEAMATGLPVVAGRVGGNPEIVADGLTGTLYDPSAPDALGMALCRYLDSTELRGRHGTAARAHVLHNFSLDAMVNRYVALYDEVIGAVARYPGSRVAVRS